MRDEGEETGMGRTVGRGGGRRNGEKPEKGQASKIQAWGIVSGRRESERDGGKRAGGAEMATGL
eukprot:5353586-Pleurochrysis_carterae.AAC.1